MENCGRVLIIDDEYIMRQGIKHMIDWEQEGFVVVGEASNGKEGLEKIGALNPHIVLCDIVMPLIDGVDLVKLVQQKYPGVQTIMLSGYDKFEYVKETLMNGAVDYLLKPTLNPEDLLKTLYKAAQRVPGLVLQKKGLSHSMLLEKYLMGEDMEEGLQNEILPFGVIQMLAVHVRRQQKADTAQLVMEKLVEGLKESLDGKIEFFGIREELFCVIVQYERKKQAVIEQGIRDVIAGLLVYEEQLYAVLGRAVSSLLDLKRDYDEYVSKAAEQSFYEKGKSLVVEKEENVPVISVPKFDFPKFTGLLNSRQYTDVFVMLKEHIRQLAHARIAEDKLKNTTKNLFYNIFSLLDQHETEQEGHSEAELETEQDLDQMRYHFFRVLDHTSYLEDYLECFDQCMEELRSYLGRQEESDKRIGQILEYIDEHLREDLDLTQLAQVFHFNYSYLSAYFNSRMPEGFSGYLNRIRIDKARRLLETGKLSIARVSEESGYSDQSYFCRVFKKTTGMTPSEFRREQMRRSL